MRETKPIHYQISDILRQRISAGQYGDTGLPPELMLVEEFGVSRHTVRSALQRLVVDGLIERRAGFGTTVTNRAAGGSWLIGSLDELLEYSVERLESVEARLVPARDVPHAAALFNTPLTGKVFRLVRILNTASGLRSSVANIFTSAVLAAHLPRTQLDKVLFINLLQKHSGVRAERVRQVSSATLADKELALQLDTKVGAPILLLHRTYTSTDGEPIMLVELSCRPDRYQHTITFLHERNELPAKETASPAAQEKSAAKPRRKATSRK